MRTDILARTRHDVVSFSLLIGDLENDCYIFGNIMKSRPALMMGDVAEAKVTLPVDHPTASPRFSMRH